MIMQNMANHFLFGSDNQNVRHVPTNDPHLKYHLPLDGRLTDYSRTASHATVAGTKSPIQSAVARSGVMSSWLYPWTTAPAGASKYHLPFQSYFNGTGDYSIVIGVQFNEYPGGANPLHLVVALSDASGNHEIKFGAMDNGGAYRQVYSLDTYEGGYASFYTPSYVEQIKRPLCLAFVKKGSANGRFYINGDLKASGTVKNVTVMTAFSIGNYGPLGGGAGLSSHQLSNGNVWMLRSFSRALDPSEVVYWTENVLSEKQRVNSMMVIPYEKSSAFIALSDMMVKGAI